MFSLAHKVALVSGSSRGLGWAIARSLAHAGAHVFLNGRDAATLQPRCEELRAAGLKADVAAFDVNDHDASARAIAGIANSQGRFDILIANAGIARRGTLTEMPVADFRHVLETNLVGVWALARAAADSMIARGTGRIVFTGSIAGMLGRPTLSAYTASKAAVHALAHQLATELGPHGITVNAIAPGYFKTEINAALAQTPSFDEWIRARTPAGRWGRPEELGPVAVFLASDEASYVNGHVLVVDGGMSASM